MKINQYISGALGTVSFLSTTAASSPIFPKDLKPRDWKPNTVFIGEGDKFPSATNLCTTNQGLRLLSVGDYANLDEGLLCRAQDHKLIPLCKSKNHKDGEQCFDLETNQLRPPPDQASQPKPEVPAKPKHHEHQSMHVPTCKALLHRINTHGGKAPEGVDGEECFYEADKEIIWISYNNNTSKSG